MRTHPVPVPGANQSPTRQVLAAANRLLRSGAEGTGVVFLDPFELTYPMLTNAVDNVHFLAPCHEEADGRFRLCGSVGTTVAQLLLNAICN